MHINFIWYKDFNLLKINSRVGSKINLGETKKLYDTIFHLERRLKSVRRIW